MTGRPNPRIPQENPAFPPFPLDRETWAEVVATLRFSPKQAAIVELLIVGACDKQIAKALDLSVDTVQTYLKRIRARLNVRGRVEVAVKAMTTALEITQRNGCH